MNKTDIIIWYRIYLPTGGGTDVQFKPLSYRSFDDFTDEFNEKTEELGFVDYEVVDWDYLTEGEAYSMNMDEDVWDKWNTLFEVSKEYGIPANVIVDASDGYDDSFKEFVENAYRGEDDSVLDYAYTLLDEIELSDDQYEIYFDYDAFGYALDVNGDLSMLILDDWEDRYDSLLEAEAVYEEISSMRNEDIAVWYIDMIGDTSDLGKETIKTFFDYKKFARDLEYEGYREVGGYIWSNY
tara:strand:- start:323 stop:1039 length:717 start_codon:yes stop_codon:yes gene_type:complete